MRDLPRALIISTDPLVHACIAAAVAAPLVRGHGRRALVAAVVPAIAIDVDHAVAARSLRVRDMIVLDTRPRTHSLLVVGAAAAAVGIATRPVYGWATFGGLLSHLLHDAGDDSAPTPILWPFAPARQLGRRRQLVGTAALVAVSRAVGGGRARPRTG